MEKTKVLRPRPNKGLLIELCGGYQPLIESVHHGLYETPLQDFYPHLNLDDAVVFAACSWLLRYSEDKEFKRLIESGEIYNIFNKVNREGFPLLNRFKNLSRWKKKHQKLNPFKGRNLKARLERVGPTAVKELIKRLRQDVDTYTFACKYDSEKSKRRGDTSKLHVMSFQNVYPKRSKIAPAYASEVTRMFRGYPSYYEPLPIKQDAQLTLF